MQNYYFLLVYTPQSAHFAISFSFTLTKCKAQTYVYFHFARFMAAFPYKTTKSYAYGVIMTTFLLPFRQKVVILHQKSNKKANYR